MRVAANAEPHKQVHANNINAKTIDETMTNRRFRGILNASPVLRPAVCRASGNCKPCCQVSQLADPVKKLQTFNGPYSTDGYRKLLHPEDSAITPLTWHVSGQFGGVCTLRHVV
jgi:hypothetical protein